MLPPEFLLFLEETANNWVLPTLSILPRTVQFYQIFSQPPDLQTEESKKRCTSQE